MGLFDSTSRTAVDTRNTPFNTGFSEIGGPATTINLNIATGTKSGGTIKPVINLTDQGAINAALAVSDRSIRSIEQFGNNITGLIEGITTAIRGQGSDAIDAIVAANQSGIAAVSEANRTELENLGMTAIKWGALALAAYLVVQSLGGFK